MVTRFVVEDWQDWLLPGNPQDPRLFHGDKSDLILVVPPHLGQGYIQEIPLQDDLNLRIYDYRLNQTLIIDAPATSNRLEFEFYLEGDRFAGSSSFIPSFGFRELVVKRPYRVFKLEIAFKYPSLIPQFHAFTDRMYPKTQAIARRCMQYLWQTLGKPGSTLMGTFNQVLKGEIVPPPDMTFYQHMPETLSADLIDLQYEARRDMTTAMEVVIGQILSCPYQGVNRRTYLEEKVLDLVALRLKGMTLPFLKTIDQDCIDQAAAILRRRIANPPTIEELARLVGTNRLYLNRGFQQVYGTTPFGYSKDCRLWKASRLLMHPDLSVGQVATAVGYTNCSHFATAFRQGMGLNPKTFQMETGRWASNITPAQSLSYAC